MDTKNKIRNIVIGICTFVLFFAFAGVTQASYLKVGSRGDDVSNLQAWLIERGFDIPAISNGFASMGYFGSQTQNAVSKYQESVGLPVTGGIDSSISSDTSLKLGALSSPDLASSYFSFGGVREWRYSASMSSTGSTTCNFLTPPGITTLVAATAYFSNIASTSIPVIGWSQGGWATTTTIGSVQITGASSGTVVASSTASTFIVPGSTYISVKIPGGAIAGTTAPAGTCKLVLREVQ